MLETLKNSRIQIRFLNCKVLHYRIQNGRNWQWLNLQSWILCGLIQCRLLLSGFASLLDGTLFRHATVFLDGLSLLTTGVLRFAPWLPFRFDWSGRLLCHDLLRHLVNIEICTSNGVHILPQSVESETVSFDDVLANHRSPRFAHATHSAQFR